MNIPYTFEIAAAIRKSEDSKVAAAYRAKRWLNAIATVYGRQGLHRILGNEKIREVREKARFVEGVCIALEM